MTNALQVIQVSPGTLKPNDWNSNYVDPHNEAKLEESMRRFGAYKPVICRELEDGTLEILGGEHRARAASKLGLETIAVVNLGRMDDKRAKAIGLADNGRYGDDDLTRLASILGDLDSSDAASYLPFSEKDLASIFSAQDMNFDDLELPSDHGTDDELPLPSMDKPTLTHVLMRFKVPVGDAGTVQEVLDIVLKARGYSKDADSLAAAGMALVDVCRSAREVI